MTAEHKLRDKLRKIQALFEGAKTPGERFAAAAALDRVKRALGEFSRPEPLVEWRFTLADLWQRRLFAALCHRHGLAPFRYRGQRHTTAMVRGRESFFRQTLWPEYVELRRALEECLDETTERIIQEEVYRNTREAPRHA